MKPKFTNPNKLPKALRKAWIDGRNQGLQEAHQQFQIYLSEQLNTLTDIPGIGEERKKQIMEHILIGQSKREASK